MKCLKLTKPQLTSLRWARRKYQDGRVPPFLFRDYRSIDKLIRAEIIEPYIGYGAPMYQFTSYGLAILEAEDSKLVPKS